LSELEKAASQVITGLTRFIEGRLRLQVNPRLLDATMPMGVDAATTWMEIARNARDHLVKIVIVKRQRRSCGLPAEEAPSKAILEGRS
jgi:hypothetical protein